MNIARQNGRTMRAAHIVGPGRLEVAEVPLPLPAPSQVRIRVLGCGVCGSNLPVWRGRPWIKYPLEPGAPGHEGWGEVEALGSEVEARWLGRRVAFLSERAFAEYDIAQADSLVDVPDGRTIFPGEALGCAVNIFRRAEIQADHTVALVGAGFLGALLVQLATRCGARVLALSRRPYALELARRCGAVEAISAADPGAAVAQVMALTTGRGCDRVIEAAGEQAALDLAGELVAQRGRLVVAGYHQEERRVNMQLWNWRGIDVINAHERDCRRYVSGMRAAAAEVSSGRLDPEPLYTHRFALEHGAAAFTALEERPAGFLKAWIAPAAAGKASVSA